MKSSDGKFDPVAIRRLDCVSGERFTFCEVQDNFDRTLDEQSSSRSKDCSTITRKKTLRPSVASSHSPNDSLVRELHDTAKPQVPKLNKVLLVYKSKQSSRGRSPSGQKQQHFEADSREQVYSSDPNSQQTTTASFQDYCKRYYKNTSKSLSKRETLAAIESPSSSSKGQQKKSSFMSKIIAIHGKQGQRKHYSSRLAGPYVDATSKKCKLSSGDSNSSRPIFDALNAAAVSHRSREKNDKVFSFKDLTLRLADAPLYSVAQKPLAERIHMITNQDKSNRSRNSSLGSKHASPCRHHQTRATKLRSNIKQPSTAKHLTDRSELLQPLYRDASINIKPLTTHRDRSPLIEVNESLQAVYKRKHPLLSSKMTDLSSHLTTKQSEASSKGAVAPSQYMMVNLGRLKRLMVKLRSDKENTEPPNTIQPLATGDYSKHR